MSKTKKKAKAETQTEPAQFDTDIPISPKANTGRGSKIREFLSAMPVGGSTVVPKSQSGNWRAHAQKLGFKIVTRTEGKRTNNPEDMHKDRIWRTA